LDIGRLVKKIIELLNGLLVGQNALAH